MKFREQYEKNLYKKSRPNKANLPSLGISG